MRIRFLAFLCVGWSAGTVLGAPADNAGVPAEAADRVVAEVRWARQFERAADLVRGVDTIVVARWQGARAGRTAYLADGTGLPFTLNSFTVEYALKGELAPGAEITLEQTGGQFGNFVVSINDGGPYTDGRYLLFLDRQQDTGYFYLVNPQGRFKILGERLHAVRSDDAVAQRFDGLSLNAARERIRALRER